MLKIKINEEMCDIAENTTLAEILINRGYLPDAPIAVAVNKNIISPLAREKYFLNDQDQIEIIAPTPGG